MPLYPLFADLRGREVLVVGGGEVATRKIEALLRAGARVQVHAHGLSPLLIDWSATGRVQHLVAAFDPAWLDDVWLVVAATDDGTFNAMLAAQAGERKRLVNVVDDASLSTFHVPVVVDRDPLLVAVSSSGTAPMLARRLGWQLETQLDSSWSGLASLFARHRQAIRQRFPDLAKRRQWYDELIDGDVMALLQHDKTAAEQALLAALQSTNAETSRDIVSLIVLPDGRSEHLTLKALRVMHQADHAVLHTSMDATIAALTRRDASRTAIETFDGDGLPFLVQHATKSRRVVVLWPDSSPLPEITGAIHGALVEVMECMGQSRRVQ